MRELLYTIEWPSVRQLCIGILCTYWHFVCALPYSVIELTQSPWDSGSWIDTYLQNVGSYCIGQLSSWVQVGRSHNTVMGRRVVLGEVVTEVSAAGFPINEKLALTGAVLDPIEAHIDGFGYFCFIVTFAKPYVVELWTRIGVCGCGCLSSWRVVRIGMASWPL